MKSYTDLSQSKTLSKILPHETADMWFVNGIVVAKDSVNEPDDIKSVFPYWSLAALLSVLPDRICLDNEKYYLNYKKDKVEYLGPLTWDGQKCITSKANTLVDACYEMILKLHELNLL